MSEPCPICGHLAMRRVYEVPRPAPALVTDEDVAWWLARYESKGINRSAESVRYNIDLGKRIGTYSPFGIHRWKKSA